MATSRDLTPDDAPVLTALYDDYAWWDDRDTDSVRGALSETEVAVGVEEGGDLVAAARVLTDFAYYATVFDVIVAADRREEGFGAFLVAEIVEHPALRSMDSRCSADEDWCRSTNRSDSSGSNPKSRFPRAGPRR
jgi:hypothetical protein